MNRAKSGAVLNGYFLLMLASSVSLAVCLFVFSLRSLVAIPPLTYALWNSSKQFFRAYEVG
ncbi:MAG TPA: hypothetical protein VEC02_04435, partial [Nitrososphaerales archaeon]|nr:hypothetical protein [Nitrososphaerales archaeon]